MIKPEELRIGNYVKFVTDRSTWMIGKVKAINPNKVTVDNYNIKYCNLSPIKITEKLLLKCGFEKNDKITITNPFTILLRNDKYLSISDIDNCNQMAWIYSMECGVISDLICIHNFDYDGFMPLHKLQNIYYLFCNKELEVKL